MATDEQQHPHPDDVAVPPAYEAEGGEAACFLERVCPECGRVADTAPPTACPRCGAPVGTD